MSKIKKKAIDEKKIQLIDRLATKSIKGGTRLWCRESHPCKSGGGPGVMMR